ncbi:MAG: cyclic nucleotide-binding domain-containing protein [Solirubrobacteraceae bacterium]
MLRTVRRGCWGFAILIRGETVGDGDWFAWVTVTCTSPGGRETMLALRGPAEMLGELSALDGEPRSATAVAVSDVEAIVVSGSTPARALDDVDTAGHLIRVLASR